MSKGMASNKRRGLRQGSSSLRNEDKPRGSYGRGYWDSLKWKAVDVSNENLGDFGDSVFLGLEELDASMFTKKTAPAPDAPEPAEEVEQVAKKTKKRKHTEEAIAEPSPVAEEQAPVPEVSKKAKKAKKAKLPAPVADDTATAGTSHEDQNALSASVIAQAMGVPGQWGAITMPLCMVRTLQAMDFPSPTPIQVAGIDMVRKGNNDIVGVAETGSGKTLAFGLPIIESILRNWTKPSQSPYALIITPTRELALQIRTVLSEYATQLMQSICLPPCKPVKMNIMAIIGGFSDLKQRRLLLAGAVHVLIATPGRFLELLQDVTIPALQDMSTVRYLVLDEADRIMEDGHFAEVRQIMEIILDHETIASNGQDVRTVLDQRLKGDDIQYSDDEADAPEVKPLKRIAGERQTLLFSATAVEMSNKQVKVKITGTLRGLASGYTLNHPIKELLAAISRQKIIDVVDVTHRGAAAVDAGAVAVDKDKEQDFEMSVVLPVGLKQYEVHCTNEDKDVFTYYYLYKNLGRSLIFVNSIKCAKRLFNILSVLNLNCHVLHADLDQKQRISTLEAYSTKINSVLIATDVAARGLDIKNINHVLHYDIARTPQLYVHRSGRSARANTVGCSVSIITPEDVAAHNAICTALIASTATNKKVPCFPKLTVDLQVIARIRDRVQIAKKIFTLSHKLSQANRESNWLQLQSQQTELDLDEELLHESGHHSEEHKQAEREQKATLRGWRQDLKLLLGQSLELDHSQTRPAAAGKKKSKSGKKNAPPTAVDWKHRKAGFFVYAK